MRLDGDLPPTLECFLAVAHSSQSRERESIWVERQGEGEAMASRSQARGVFKRSSSSASSSFVAGGGAVAKPLGAPISAPLGNSTCVLFEPTT